MSNSILDTLNENQRTAATTINEQGRAMALSLKKGSYDPFLCI